MSFDVFFEPCRYDGTTEWRRHPVTNLDREVPKNAPLTDREVAAVTEALDRAGATAADAHGYRVVRFSDGGAADIFTNDCHGCMFSIRDAGVTPALAQLLFDVMIAGDWVLTFQDDTDEVAIAPNARCVAIVPSFYTRVAIAESTAEMKVLLEGGFDAWKRYCAG
ncbi:MAG TPA: hypothetical protein VGH87_23965 [Polyangiaceae bacterium]